MDDTAFKKLAGTGIVTVYAIPKAEGCSASPWCVQWYAAELGPLIEASNKAGMAVYLCDQGFALGKPRRSENAQILYIVLDDDGRGLDCAWFPSHGFPPPNVAVRSARGCHYFWRVHGMSVPDHALYVRAIAAIVNDAANKEGRPGKVEGMSAANGTRIPGTMHESGTPVTLEHFDDAPEAYWLDLKEAFGVRIEAPASIGAAASIAHIPMSERVRRAQEWLATQPAADAEGGRHAAISRAVLVTVKGFAVTDQGAAEQALDTWVGNGSLADRYRFAQRSIAATIRKWESSDEIGALLADWDQDLVIWLEAQNKAATIFRIRKLRGNRQ